MVRVFLEVICNEPVDLVLILDMAGSTLDTDDDLDRYKSFVTAIIRNFELGSDATQIGLIVAGDGTAANIFFLNTYIGGEATMEAQVNALSFLGGELDVSAAVALARDNQFTQANGDRDSVVNVIVTIVDKMSTLNSADVRTEADAAQANGIVMFGIGVGTQYSLSNSIETTELRSLSSEPREMNVNYYPVTSYANLDGIRRSVVDSVCEAEAPPTIGTR